MAMFERFTERARRVLILAQEEAKRLHHSAVGTEHILLGVIREGEGVACKVLESLNISLERVRAEIESAIGRGEHTPYEEVAFTRRAKKVLELALDEARRLGHNYIGTEHLLLGLIREGEELAARVLEVMGADLERTRAHVVYVLGEAGDADPGAATARRADWEREFGDALERCTGRARWVIILAQEESRRLGHGTVEPEHFLLGIIREGECVASKVLDSMNISLKRLRAEIESAIGRRDRTPYEAALSSRARKVMGLALDEARRLGHDYIGTEHLLLGVIRVENGVAARLLEAVGADLERARAQVVNLLNTGETEVDFTAGARNVLKLSHEEAHRLGHNQIDTGHLLLGLIRARALEAFGTDPENLRRQLASSLGREGTISSATPSAPKEDAVIRTIDLNVDAGESYGAYRIGADEEIIPLITSANVACGAHGGDPLVMRRTVRLAASHGVAVGAHPGYPDLQGFGRRPMDVPPEELVQILLYQIGALAAIAGAETVALQHVKPHGALYHAALSQPSVADAVIEAVGSMGLPLVALSGSGWAERARRAGLRVAEEAFLDRGYRSDGTLVPRGQPGALITDPQEAAERAVQLVTEGTIRAVTGEIVTVRADTLCMHSDTPGVAALVRAAREALTAAGVRVAPLGEWAR